MVPSCSGQVLVVFLGQSDQALSEGIQMGVGLEISREAEHLLQQRREFVIGPDHFDGSARYLAAAQRAFVYVSSLNWSVVGANVKVSPTWANAGATPTRRLRISTNWKASHGELPADFDINYVRPPGNLFLGPNGKAEIGTVFIPMRDIQAAIEERLNLYVWGRATYDDMFEGSKPHFFEFCQRLEVAGEIPGNINLSFTQFGLSNGSDEDSQLPAEPA